MPVMVTQAFADSVQLWIDAYEAGTGAASAAWQRVMIEGMQCFLRTTPEVVAGAQSVLDGEAVIFGGRLMNVLGTGGIGGATFGGGEAGFATLAGIGVGLAVSAAVLVVAGSWMCIQAKNRRDMNATRQDAFQLYLYQYWPRYLRWAFRRLTPYTMPPAPYTFEEFFRFRGDKTTVLGR